MSLFAVGDLHLPGGQDKPMSVFGPQWDRHFFRISESWREQVRAEDTVLIPGEGEGPVWELVTFGKVRGGPRPGPNDWAFASRENLSEYLPAAV